MDIIIWVIILPLILAFLLGIIKIFNNKKVFYWLVITGTLFYTYLLVYIIRNGGQAVVYSVGNWGLLGINIILDAFSLLMLLIMAFLPLLVIIFSLKYMQKNVMKYFVLTFLLMAGIAGMVLTADLFNLYVFLEITSISSVALVAVKKTDNAIEGSFKYLILGTFGSFFILLATILTYQVTGTLNMAEIAVEYRNISPFLRNVFMIFFIFGFGLKIGLVPLHTWLPDAYVGSPIPYNVLSSGLVMKSAMYALIRILYILFGLEFLLESGILAFGVFWGVITFLIAHTIAYQQTNLRKLLGYSSIAQIGYITVGLFLGTAGGIIGGNFHILNHAIMKGALFLVVGVFYYSIGSREIEDVEGLGYVYPGLSFVFTVAALAIVGLPPFNGFVSKWLIIEAAIEADYFTAAFFIPVGTFLSLTYYLKIIINLYTKSDKNIISRKPDWTLKSPAIILGALCILFGLWPSLPLRLINHIPEMLLENSNYIRILLGG